MKICVIILNWNGKSDTLDCLASLRKVEEEHQTVVVDNGSDDDSVSSIRKIYPEITLLETGENLGFAEGNNVGIRYALERGAEYLFILNNDTVVDPNILTAFLENPDAPIQGSKAHLMSAPSLLDHLGGNWNLRTGEFDLVGAREKAEGWTEPLTLDYVCGVALFVKAEVFKKIGLFEENFFLFWEESDWCLRAKKAGYPATFCPNAKLLHKVSASFVGGKPHSTYFWWRGRLLWIERNCSSKERWSLTFRILLPDILRILKLYLLRSLSLRKTPERLKKIRTYRAALSGVKDYLIRRYGSGPSWLFQK
ncbi:MAG: N-acetylglucosaminyl-diphospho-decaprenol L-rhamnosyltransferase [Chlamydiae bacterium]|nr:N-acetylglucosaminyl-diphospho-decaprenol L-rhamnosyltransferase [Chlamydiota bacterium]